MRRAGRDEHRRAQQCLSGAELQRPHASRLLHGADETDTVEDGAGRSGLHARHPVREQHHRRSVRSGAAPGVRNGYHLPRQRDLLYAAAVLGGVRRDPECRREGRDDRRQPFRHESAAGEGVAHGATGAHPYAQRRSALRRHLRHGAEEQYPSPR